MQIKDTIDVSSLRIENLNVLHLTTGNHKRGIADYTRDIMTALTSYGVEHTLFFLDNNDFNVIATKTIEEKLDHCSKQAQQADLIHIQHEFAFFDKHDLWQSINIFQQFLQTFYQLNKPVLVTFHTEADFFNAPSLCSPLTQAVESYDLQQALQQHWKKTISSCFNTNPRLHALTHTHKTKLALINSGMIADKITIMPLGITPRANLARLDSQQAKQILSYSKDSILLSIFGFITENKGHEFAIKALKLLPKTYYLAITGGEHPEGKNSNKEKISALVASDPDFSQRVRITGYVNQPTADLYHAATDICLAPYHGTMSGSGAIGWALASGKPVIASNTTTFTEINQQAKCLLMCPEKSVAELAKQIEYLMTNRDLQTTLVKNALNYVARHSWPEVSKKIIACYEKCLTAYD